MSAISQGSTAISGTRGHLDAEMTRLRLMIERRVLWLRGQWSRDPLAAERATVISDAEAEWLLAQSGGAECEFYSTDARAQELERSIEEAAERARACAEESVPPLDRLAAIFELSPFERDVLLLCLAGETDPGFERLYGYVQDDLSRRCVTPHLAASLLSPGQVTKAMESFLPGSALRRYRLIAMDDIGSLATRAVRIDERMVQYLLGSERLDRRVAEIIEPPQPVPEAAEWVTLSEQIARALVTPPRWRALHLAGAPDTGRRAIAAAVCGHFGLNLQVVDVARLRTAGLRELLPLMEREAVLAEMVYYFDLEKAGEEREQFARELGNLGVFRITVSQEGMRPVNALVVNVAALGARSQASLWRDQIDGAEVPDETIDQIVEQFHFGPELIRRSTETARQLAALRPSDGVPSITEDDLWRACRMQSGGELANLAQRITPCHDWEDLILPEDALRQLEEVAAQVAHRALVYESWGFGRKLNRGRGVAALFAGPSGTGKTLAAEVLAAHLRLDLFRIDLAAVVSKYIGETEKNLRCVFDAAERCGAVLFFDEADSLFARRSEVKDSHDRYANLEVNYLLQRMEDYRGLAVLATNRKDVIDEAFLRRLRFIVEFPFPDSKQRARIWQSIFPPETPLDGIDYIALARLEVPGGSIRNVALNAAFQAAAQGGPVTMQQLMGAARREYRKIGKLMREAEFGRYYTEAE